MTWLQALRNAIRTFLVTRETENVVTDLVNNGLTSADIAIVDAFLAENVTT